MQLIWGRTCSLIAAIATTSFMFIDLARDEEAGESCNAAHENALKLLEAGKLRASLGPLATCNLVTCPEVIQEDCRALIEKTTASIPTVEFDVRDGADNALSDVSLTIDGDPVAVRAGSPIRLDPGAHVFRFSTPGRPPVEKRLVVSAREEKRERIVIGASDTAATAPPRDSEAVAPPAQKERSVVASVGASSTGQSTLGWIAGGVGVGGLALGAVFGLTAMSKNDRAHCDKQSVCEDPQSRRDAQGAAAISTVGFVAGGAFGALGIVLLATAPRASSSSARLRVWPVVGGSNIGAAGSF